MGKRMPRVFAGKLLFSMVSVANAITAFLFDWNGTHLFNPTWPGHARFHDAQTMFLGLGLCLVSLIVLWTPPGVTGRRLHLAWLSSSLYWLAFLAACLAPGTTLFDAGFEIPRPLGIPANLLFGLLMLLLATCAWLIARPSERQQGKRQ